MVTPVLKKDLISYQATNSFTNLALDLHSGDKKLEPFVNRFFSLENLESQIVEKSKSREVENSGREVLHAALTRQYQGTKASNETTKNIDALLAQNTFTITTGHQLCLFGGPLYFFYKIIHTINLAKKLKERNPDKTIVPVFWMATEDHDFAEIASVLINGQKVTWEKDSKQAPVGRLYPDLDAAFHSLEQILGEGPKAGEVVQFLKKHYQNKPNLAVATRSMVNELFGKYGLVIIDGDDRELKRLFAPIVQRELKEQLSFKAVSSTDEELSKHYKIQVNPRTCNLFLFEEGVRRRLDRSANGFVLADTDIQYSEAELLSRLDEKPEDFSPNVLLRPVYEEVILPNLAYIGGGGELAYWLQLKQLFDSVSVPMPILVLRNSVQLMDSDQLVKLDKLGLETNDIFKTRLALAKQLVEQLESEDFYRLNEEINHFKSKFSELSFKVSEKDSTLVAHVDAQWKKQVHFLLNLEKKLLRAGKKKHSVSLDRLNNLLDEILPGGGLQERKANAFTWIFRHGFQWIDELVSELDPENQHFTMLTS